MKRAVFIVPILVFAGLAYFLFHSLIATPPADQEAMLIGKPVPQITLLPLDANAAGITPQDFKGHVTVLNVFASWCAPCRAEAPVLAKLKGVALYGIVYRDTPQKARAFLSEVGNPFSRIGRDDDGAAGAAWGVADVPQTFVIDAQGIVRLRSVGELTPDVLEDEIQPAIEQARKAG